MVTEHHMSERHACALVGLLLRPHEVSSGGIFDAGILKVAHHPLG
jgi:hypothetical protein